MGFWKWMFHGDFGFVQLAGLLELGIAMKGWLSKFCVAVVGFFFQVVGVKSWEGSVCRARSFGGGQLRKLQIVWGPLLAWDCNPGNLESRGQSPLKVTRKFSTRINWKTLNVRWEEKFEMAIVRWELPKLLLTKSLRGPVHRNIYSLFEFDDYYSYDQSAFTFTALYLPSCYNKYNFILLCLKSVQIQYQSPYHSIFNKLEP